MFALNKSSKNCGLRFGIWVIVPIMICISLFACSDKKDNEDGLKQAVERFWQAQLDGRWSECYNTYSLEMIQGLVKSNPEIFKSVQNYSLARNREADNSKIVDFSVVSIEFEEKSLSAKVKMGISTRGRQKHRMVVQYWRFVNSVKKWQIVPNAEFN